MSKISLIVFFHNQTKLNYQHNLIKAILILNKEFYITVYDKHRLLSNEFLKKNKLNIKVIDDFEILRKNINYYDIAICGFYQDIYQLKKINNNIKILNVWHGSPIRKICFDNKKEKTNPMLKFEKRNVFHLVQNNFYAKIFQKAFKTNKNNIIISNFFYTEYFNFSRFTKKLIKNFIRFFSIKKKILFCPTHDPNYSNKDFFLRFQELKKIIDESINYTIYIKQHELDSSVINNSNKNIKLLPKNYDLNNNFYLFDFFITDISSSVIDWFNITKREFLLIKPNESYLKDHESYFNLNELYMNEKNAKKNYIKLVRKNFNSFYRNFLEKIISSKNQNLKKIIYKLINDK